MNGIELISLLIALATSGFLIYEIERNRRLASRLSSLEVEKEGWRINPFYIVERKVAEPQESVDAVTMRECL